MRRVIKYGAAPGKLILVLTIILGFCGIVGSAEYSAADDSKNLEYLFVITGDTGTYKEGRLTLTGVPIVSFNYLGSTREVGHFLVGSFVEVWNKNSSTYNANPPSGTLSMLDEKGAANAVIAVSNPSSSLNSITFDTKVLEGNVPESFNASTVFLELKVDQKLETQN